MDARTIEGLIAALQDYTGGVVLVSHDQALLEQCATTLWVVEKNKTGKQHSLLPKRDVAPISDNHLHQLQHKLTNQTHSNNKKNVEPVSIEPPPRCIVRRFPGSFDDYRESILGSY